MCFTPALSRQSRRNCFTRFTAAACSQVASSPILIVLLWIVPCVASVNWESCNKEIRSMLQQPNFTKNTADYFFQHNGSLFNGNENITLTLRGCNEFCGSGGWYLDSGPRVMTWAVPVILLLGNIDLPPLKRIVAVIHVLGDPIDSFFSLLKRLDGRRRLYKFVLRKPANTGKDAKTNTKGTPVPSPIPRFQIMHGHQRDRAKVIATVLGAFEEILSTNIEPEDFYQMVMHQLGQIGEPNEDPEAFEIWCHTAIQLADARTSDFPRSCLAILIYIFLQITALLPSIGASNTSTHRGLFFSLMILSWLVPFALSLSALGTFVSRRICLDIMRHFVTDVTQIGKRRGTTPQSGYGIAAIVTEKIEPEAVHTCTPFRKSAIDNGADFWLKRNPHHSREPYGTDDANRPYIQDDLLERLLVSCTGDKVNDGDKFASDYLDHYFRSLHSLYNSRTNVIVLGGVFPVLLSFVGTLAITCFAVPVGPSFQFVRVIAIFFSWAISAVSTCLMHILGKSRLGPRKLWLVILIKDGLIGLSSILLIFLAAGGLSNNCYYWSAYGMNGRPAYVPLKVSEEHREYVVRIYSIVLGTMVFAQPLFFVGVLLWSWRGLRLMRWSERQLRKEFCRSYKLEEPILADQICRLYFRQKAQPVAQLPSSQPSSLLIYKSSWELLHTWVDRGISNRVKLWIQSRTTKPIVWWPLSHPQPPGTIARVDRPSASRPAEAVKSASYERPSHTNRHKLAPLKLADENKPTQSPQVLSNVDNSGLSFPSKLDVYQSSGSVSGPQTRPATNSDSGYRTENDFKEYTSCVNSGTPSKKWVHWCVGTKTIKLSEIWVEDNNRLKSGCQFIQELKKSYRKVRGLRWWISLTSLAEVKTVKVIRLLDNQNLVKCRPAPVQLDEIRTAKDYEISLREGHDEDMHMQWVEGVVAYHLQHRTSEKDLYAIDDAIPALPKKRGQLAQHSRACGYGIRAVQGWSVLRIMIFFGFFLASGLTFCIIQLVTKASGIEPAAAPYVMILGTLSLFTVLMDLYID